MKYFWVWAEILLFAAIICILGYLFYVDRTYPTIEQTTTGPSVSMEDAALNLTDKDKAEITDAEYLADLKLAMETGVSGIVGMQIGDSVNVTPCDTTLSKYLFAKFDYWWKTYDHRGNTASESFAVFPGADSALITVGANYDDYKCLMEYANGHGYDIELITKENGYYYQLKQLRGDK